MSMRKRESELASSLTTASGKAGLEALQHNAAAVPFCGRDVPQPLPAPDAPPAAVFLPSGAEAHLIDLHLNTWQNDAKLLITSNYSSCVKSKMKKKICGLCSTQKPPGWRARTPPTKPGAHEIV